MLLEGGDNANPMSYACSELAMSDSLTRSIGRLGGSENPPGTKNVDRPRGNGEPADTRGLVSHVKSTSKWPGASQAKDNITKELHGYGEPVAGTTTTGP